MARVLVVILGGCLLSSPALADTIYKFLPNNPNHPDETVFVENVVVTDEKSGEITYYYWDKRSKALNWRSLSSSETEKFRVDYGTPEERGRLLSAIRAYGVRSIVTDIKGERTEFFCTLVHYRISGFLNESNDTSLVLEYPLGAERLEFADIAILEVREDAVSVLLKNNRTMLGKWTGGGVAFQTFMPSLILGIDKDGKEIEMDIQQVSKIEFPAND